MAYFVFKKTQSHAKQGIPYQTTNLLYRFWIHMKRLSIRIKKKIKNLGFVKEYYGFSEIQLSLVYTIVKIYNFLGCKIVNFKGCSD